MTKTSTASVEDQLARVLASRQFRDSPRLQTFLRFVVLGTLEGRGDEIKETTIASEVFGRSDTTDDSIVRSAARRLRSRLEEYYEQEGKNDPIRIVMLRGSYVPEIQGLESAPLAEFQSAPTPGVQAESLLISAEIVPEAKDHRRSSLVRPALLATAALALAIFVSLVLLQRDRLRPEHLANFEAQELYLKGRYYWSQRTPEDLNRAVDYFTQAIVKNPGYAQAYAGLADTYNLLSEYTTMPYEEAFQRAIAASQTAVRLNESLAEAHGSLAFASFYGSWDPITAEREFKRALELDPGYLNARHWYATFLMSVGREREALAEIERAQLLDPSSKSILADKCLILVYAGQLEVAKTSLEELASSDPQFLSSHQYLATIYLSERRYPSYLSELKTVAALLNSGYTRSLVAAGEKGFAEGGATKMLARMLAVQEASAGRDARYYGLAQTCALLGDKSRAIGYLRQAFDRHDINLVVLTVDPCLVRLRGEQVFQKIVDQVGVASKAGAASSGGTSLALLHY